MLAGVRDLCPGWLFCIGFFAHGAILQLTPVFRRPLFSASPLKADIYREDMETQRDPGIDVPREALWSE